MEKGWRIKKFEKMVLDNRVKIESQIQLLNANGLVFDWTHFYDRIVQIFLLHEDKLILVEDGKGDGELIYEYFTVSIDVVQEYALELVAQCNEDKIGNLDLEIAALCGVLGDQITKDMNEVKREALEQLSERPGSLLEFKKRR
ncbi:MAG: hypothetical protein WA057_01760 [Candidatus Magasanikiibacteriota bacterium]